VFVGHIGAGLAVKRFEPRLNLGALLFAALFADALLWTLVLLGVESVGALVDTGRGRFFTFVFPYSHGLAASLAWSALAGLVGWFAQGGAAGRARLACALAAAVFSHFVLDVIDHVPDMPLLGEGSAKLGLGLWRDMPAAIAVELAIAAAGLALYLSGVRRSRGRTALVAGLTLAAALLTAAGPYAPGLPPPAAVLAATSLVTVFAVVLVGFVLERGLALTARR
jgi:hypothetical protein